jgi:hypothetical protein
MTPFVEAARQIVRGIVWAPGPYSGMFGGKDLHWRHHGLGMLQAELSEELRVHIWHPKLVSEGMVWPRCVHDHRFDITSAVVLGEVIDVPYKVVEGPGRNTPRGEIIFTGQENQRVYVYEIEHAKNQDQMVQKGCSTATSARQLAEAWAYEYTGVGIGADSEYRIERRRFHTTRVEALAVTVVHRSNFDDRLARVLCASDEDVTAVSGIVRDDSAAHRALVQHVLTAAADAIAHL